MDAVRGADLTQRHNAGLGLDLKICCSSFPPLIDEWESILSCSEALKMGFEMQHEASDCPQPVACLTKQENLHLCDSLVTRPHDHAVSQTNTGNAPWVDLFMRSCLRSAEGHVYNKLSKR